MAKKEEVIDLKPKAEKITDEQLKEVQQVISVSNQIKLEIGNIAARKHMLLHELNTVNEKMSEINKNLEEEYGKMDIDINTGAINYPEDEQADS
jgi:spore germination protein YaaH